MSRSNQTTRRPHQPIARSHSADRIVGKRLRLRREMLNLTRRELAAKIGGTPEEIMALEAGDSHPSAGLLYELCCVLDVPVGFFFEAEATLRPVSTPGDASAENAVLRSALRALLAVVELADQECGIDDDCYQAAKSKARAALADGGQSIECPVGQFLRTETSGASIAMGYVTCR